MYAHTHTYVPSFMCMKLKYSDNFAVHSWNNVTQYSVSIYSPLPALQFAPHYPLQLESPAQMSQSIYVFMQDTVDRCHVSGHVPIP